MVHDFKDFDVSLKDLIEVRAADWLTFLGLTPTGPVEIANADLAAVSGAADKVMRVAAAQPWIFHLELYSSPRTDPVEQVQWYNTLVRHRHGLPVRSVVVLLRRAANSPQWTGLYRHELPGEDRPYLEFRYHVIRLWEVPTEQLLSGGLGVVPLAPLGDASDSELERVVQQMSRRLDSLPIELSRWFWSISYALTGLRVPKPGLDQLYRGVIPVDYMSILKDSSVIQHFQRLAEEEGARKGELKGELKGQLTHARATLLRLGRRRLGEPDAASVAAVESITDLDRLDRMSVAIFDAASWEQLLATP